EVMFPIESPALKKRVIEEIWNTSIRDNVKRRILQPDGTYRRMERSKNDERIRAQFRFLEMEQDRRRGKDSETAAAKSGPVVLRSIGVSEEDEPVPVHSGEGSTRSRRQHASKGPATPIAPKAPAPMTEAETAEAAMGATPIALIPERTDQLE